MAGCIDIEDELPLAQLDQAADIFATGILNGLPSQAQEKRAVPRIRATIPINR